MNDTILKNIGKSRADMLHAFIGTTFILEYGIVKNIPAKGIVTVEMSVADSADDIIITNCVYANLAGSSFSLNIKPNIDDKVMVFFPRKFLGAMFKKENNEALVSECCNGYSLMGGIAVPMNQYQETTHKNYIDLSDGNLTLKLAYSKDDNKNFFTVTTTSTGAFTLVSKNTSISIDSDVITITNSHATITVDASGNVSINAEGKYDIKNGSTSMFDMLKGLKDEIANLTTTGSPSTQATSPTSKTALTNWETNQLKALFSESSGSQESGSGGETNGSE